MQHGNVDRIQKQWHGHGNVAYRYLRFERWPPGSMLLAVLVLLILYGSLYPFDFSEPQPGALLRVFTEWHLLGSRGDMLGNFVLFVPWGLAGMVTLARRAGLWRAAGITVLTGFVLAFGCQIAQVWIPARDASLADVFWNMAGLVAGLLLGPLALKHWRGSARRPATSFGAALLLCAWLLAYWLPLVPSIDFQLIKDNLKLALNARAFTFMDVLSGTSMALTSGYLLSRLVSVRRSAIYLPALLALAAVGKLFIQGTRIEIGAALGFIVGAVLWGFSPWVSGRRRTLMVGLVLIGVYTVRALSPLEFRSEPAAFGWSPLAALLQGSMLANAQTLANDLVVFTSFLFLVQASGGKPVVASLGLAVWVFALEYAQTFIETRTGEITAPLLVLLVGQAFRFADRQLSATMPLVDGPAVPGETKRSVRSMLPPWLVALTVVGIATLGLGAMLRVPALPYNVHKLFLGGGNPLALAAFSLALLWGGAGSAWLGEVVATARRPAWLLPLVALAVSLISLLLLWMSVNTWSIEKISGSSNLYWFVTNRDIWGETWRAIFLSVDVPEFIGFLERCVRYSALYAPLPIVLGLMIAAYRLRGRKGMTPLRLSGVLVSAMLTLWLCKAITFDWSSTDNLNELIARDGEWGWGGGGYLYMLLGLMCLTSLILATAFDSTPLRLLGSVLCAAASVPLGWWLLNLGLEAQVHKYGSVFSGAQFLLGPDRSHPLPAGVLFVRWAVVQTSATLVIATGTWLGLAVVDRLSGKPSPDLTANFGDPGPAGVVAGNSGSAT